MLDQRKPTSAWIGAPRQGSANSVCRKAAVECEERRAADSVKRRDRKQEAEALRKKHGPVVSPALKTPKDSFGRPGPKLALSVPPRRRASLQDDEDDSSPDEDYNDSPSRRPPPLLFEVRPPRPARLPRVSSFANPSTSRTPVMKIKMLTREDFTRSWMTSGEVWETLARMRNRYPQARTFNAPTWYKFLVKWDLDCTEYHNHESELVGHNQRLEDAHIATEATVQRDLAYLAKTRPPPIPLSARDAHDLFKRVLGPEAVPSLEVQLQAFVIEDDPQPPPTTGGPVMYAVSGHSRLFMDRDDAINVFKRTAGAELLFSRDEKELFRFLRDTAASTASQHAT
ncbi:hypothetical protein DFH08DRAFT_1039659 [Mycena albidolilacea]|uniref:Uncharacterized protein n=1 Tax=Mycena albidolilacea TaxID=1033008 RepID=A0AAD6ZCN7_9AGAR|nr:hypothetical protein DFH08DRAFT_1039659 [Mycena albidolilacea]